MAGGLRSVLAGSTRNVLNLGRGGERYKSKGRDNTVKL